MALNLIPKLLWNFSKRCKLKPNIFFPFGCHCSTLNSSIIAVLFISFSRWFEFHMGHYYWRVTFLIHLTFIYVYIFEYWYFHFILDSFQLCILLLKCQWWQRKKNVVNGDKVSLFVEQSYFNYLRKRWLNQQWIRCQNEIAFLIL